ncbi:MAG: hypothetical protein ThorAB25_24100 [Candidatus Thorarchaeota archaeon AB_25]|nr:MAG: hypothetical protein ThorAB25_24100 [Candidatus Thorarchaeota archaeon AB_25]
MSSCREEFRDSDVRSEHHFEEYGCTWIGVIVALIAIVAIMMIPAILGGNVFIFPGFGSFEPNTEFELVFVPESALVYSLVLLVVIIYWLYSRRNRSALDAA